MISIREDREKFLHNASSRPEYEDHRSTGVSADQSIVWAYMVYLGCHLEGDGCRQLLANGSPGYIPDSGISIILATLSSLPRDR